MESTQITSGGILIIKVKEGRLLRDTEVFGKMDPYCLLEIRGQRFKTKVHESGGKNPHWTDEFEL